MDFSVCSYRANLKDTLTLLKLVCETGQHTFFGARNNVHRAFKTIKRKSSVLADICLPDVRFGWLTGVWHMRVQFGGSLPALLKKVLSAGECSVKPRGFGMGILLSSLCLFHQHMCSVKPWPSQCHIEYPPPA